MESGKTEKDVKSSIAIIITGLAIFGTALIAIFAVIWERGEGLRFIASSLLPLWGTWMGTILAFYFAKENFEAASKSQQDVINRLTPEEKLSQKKVEDVMIKIATMTFINYEQDKNKSILDIIKDSSFKNFNRFPILDNNKVLMYIIHRSLFDQFISGKVENDININEIKKITLNDLLEKSEGKIKDILSKGFSFIKPGDTLLQAKNKMDAVVECEDVFITQNGKKEEPVLGWITNKIIAENSKI